MKISISKPLLIALGVMAYIILFFTTLNASINMISAPSDVEFFVGLGLICILFAGTAFLAVYLVKKLTKNF